MLGSSISFCHDLDPLVLLAGREGQTLTPSLYEGTCFCTTEGIKHLFQSFRASIYLFACLCFLLGQCTAHEAQAIHGAVTAQGMCGQAVAQNSP